MKSFTMIDSMDLGCGRCMITVHNDVVRTRFDDLKPFVEINGIRREVLEVKVLGLPPYGKGRVLGIVTPSGR